MNKAEEKNLLVQVDLLEGIREADSMILSCIQSNAMDVMKKVIEPKMYTEPGQATVELTVEEFNKIRYTLATIGLPEGLKELTPWIEDAYLNPKKEKIRLLNLLK